MDQQKLDLDSSSSNPAEFLEKSFGELFAPREQELIAQLKDLAHRQGDDSSQFQNHCEKQIIQAVDSFVSWLRPQFEIARQAIEDRLERCRQTLAKERHLLNYLEELRRKSIEHMLGSSSSKVASVGYAVLYIVLSVSAMVVYALTFHLVFEKLPRWLGFTTSVGLASFSFFVAREFYRRTLDRRDKFVKFLNISGLLSSIGWISFFTLSRGLAYHIANSSSSITSFAQLSQTSKVDIVSAAQIFSSSLAFITSIFTEFCFASGLMIYVLRCFERHKPKDLISQEIAEAEERVRRWEADEINLSELLLRANLNESALRAWAEQKKTSLLLQLEAIKAQEKEEVYKTIIKLPISILQQLSAMGKEMGDRNGRPKPKGGKPNENIKNAHVRANSSEFSDSSKHIHNDGI